MNFSINQKSLSYAGKEIFTAPSEIRNILHLQFNDTAVIVYSAAELKPRTGLPKNLQPKIDNPDLREAITRNVFCIDKKGNIVWRIESNWEYADEFNYISQQDHQYRAVRADGYSFVLNTNTGQTSNPVFIGA